MDVDNNNIILEKSVAFALRIVKLRRYVTTDAELREYDISKQLLRSATSIGANVEEAQGAQSNADFLSKISIAYKEARETRYWIRLLLGAGYIRQREEESLLSDIDEICRILSSIIMKMKVK